MKYIATFFSHFGAVRFRRQCSNAGWECEMMPVPRSLSSSCGTCVSYELSLEDKFLPEDSCQEEIEQVVRLSGDGFEWVYKAENI